MNRIIVFLLCFFMCYGAISQPISYRASDVITVSDGRLQAQYNLFIPRYTDTTAANLKKGIDSCGSIIFTYSGNRLWKRSCSPKKWDEIGSGGIDSIYRSSDSVYYTKGGNTYFAFKDSTGGGSQNLQQVTDVGASTTNTISIAKQFSNTQIGVESGTIETPIYWEDNFTLGSFFKVQSDINVGYAPAITSNGWQGGSFDINAVDGPGLKPKLNFNSTGDFLNIYSIGSSEYVKLSPDQLKTGNAQGSASTRLKFANDHTNNYTYIFSNYSKTVDSFYVPITVNGVFADPTGDININIPSAGIDSIKRSTDSIFARRNGSWIYQYKDSIGTGGSQNLQSVLNQGNLSYQKSILIVDSVNTGSSANVVAVLSSSDSIRGLVGPPFVGLEKRFTSNYATLEFNKTTYPGKLLPTIYLSSSDLGNEFRARSDKMFYKNLISGNSIYLAPPNTITNDTLKLPNATGTLLAKINSTSPDSTGNINLSYVDSLKRNVGTDSVFARKNGQWNFQYKDSIGGSSQNGRFGNDTANVVMAKIHNNSGVQLTNGKVVFLSSSGTSSDAPSVRLANNKFDSTSATTFGFVTGTINNNDTGWVILSGKIEKLNTSAFSNGDIIYLDSISGEWTKSKPSAPYHLVYLGVIVKANAGNGSIFVKPQNGYELDEIHDVKITSVANNDVLTYESSTKLWKNKSIPTVLGYTPLSPSDTVSLSNRINLKLNISDTANMLSPYVRNVPTIAYLASDFNTSSTTAASSNLSIAVAANTAYRIMINGTASKATSSTGLKIGIAAPTGTTIRANFNYCTNSINTQNNTFITAINTLYPAAANFSIAVATEMPFRVEGILITGANAGNVTLQAATVTSNTATIYATTLMTLTKAYSQ